ncbi:MAG: ABC transporter permease [Pedococcus sp.]
MTTTARPQAPTAPSAPSRLSVLRTIWARGVADKATVIGVLTFYALAFGAGVGALWIPLKDVFADLVFPAAFDAILGGAPINTPAGWVNAELLSMVGPGLLIAAALISATAATAGEEQRHTLALVLSTGVSRSTFLAAKTAAVLTHVLVVAAGMVGGLVLGNLFGDLGLGVGAMLLATLWMVLIALVYAAIALTVGTLTGDTRTTMAATAGIAAVSVVLALFLPIKASLAEWAKINLWYPYSGNVAIVDGIDWGLAAVMVTVTVVVSAIGFLGIRRRGDLRG